MGNERKALKITKAIQVDLATSPNKKFEGHTTQLESDVRP
jgi:hypothetical protein